MLLNCHMCHLSNLEYLSLKTLKFREKVVSIYETIVCGVSDVYNFLEKYQISIVLIAISFPKIDKDLQIDF